MSDEETKLGPSTLAVHGGEPAVRIDRSLTTPVVNASAYPFENTAELVDYMEGRVERPAEYGRYGNPTVERAEAKLAVLEGGQAGLLLSSGMAAITTTLLAMLRQGQHIVLTRDAYRKTRVFARQVLARYGVEVDIVEPTADAVIDAMKDNTRIVFTEAPTNPYLRVIDLARVVKEAKARRIKTVIDATFGTPVNMRPLEHGVDLVIHSATKYLGGHNDLLAGAVIGKAPLVGAIREHLGMVGAIVDPQTAFLLLRGLKTLALRVRQQNETALRLAGVLAEDPRVERVWYPMHPSHPDHEMATRYLSGGGGVVSFELHGGLPAGTRFVDAMRIPKLAPSLGGVESLVEQPALMSFYELSPDERAAIGISEGLVRLSVGIEEADDLEADLRQALAAVDAKGGTA
ncbi:MAG: aminotransferase class I/II-fold pyridoxal phosphate-dependent enzyme [Myxococcota bacterium]